MQAAWHCRPGAFSGKPQGRGTVLSGDGLLSSSLLFEGLPGVLVEAQAAGLRCIVSDTVTKEAKATDLVTYLSIEEPPARWAEEIVKQTGYARRDTARELRQAGFDVRTTGGRIQAVLSGRRRCTFTVNAGKGGSESYEEIVVDRALSASRRFGKGMCHDGCCLKTVF